MLTELKPQTGAVSRKVCLLKQLQDSGLSLLIKYTPEYGNFLTLYTTSVLNVCDSGGNEVLTNVASSGIIQKVTSGTFCRRGGSLSDLLKHF